LNQIFVSVAYDLKNFVLAFGSEWH